MPPPNPPRAATLTPVENRGWEVFQREGCFSSCHVSTIALASPGRSAGVIPDLRTTPKRSRDWYLAYLANPQAVLPRSLMPSYRHLSSDEFEALVAFLQRLNQEVVPPAPESIAPGSIPETPGDLASYESGRTLYRTYCAGCHGESGNGGGPVGHLLSPEPRDFTDVIWMSKQTERYLFSVTTNGKSRTAMPAFRDILDPRERALTIRYMQYFADPVARERMELGFVANAKHPTTIR